MNIRDDPERQLGLYSVKLIFIDDNFQSMTLRKYYSAHMSPFDNMLCILLKEWI
jgi:hypothetical protein